MPRYTPIQRAEQRDGSSRWRQMTRLHPTGRTRHVHWRAPAVMTVSVVLGLVFAIAHDRFYQSFDHTPAGSSFQQKVVVGTGTAFAFLVKMFFTIATGTAFAQQLWLSLRNGAENLNDMDSMFDVLNNMLCLGKITLWAKNPRLAIIAIVTWCIPIAAVFTPGTIHVQADLQYQNGTLLKPAQPQQAYPASQQFAASQLDWTALWRNTSGTFADALLIGPSGSLTAVTYASLSQQSILSAPAPARNSSYNLTFHGPALSCESLSEEDLATFRASINQAYKDQYLPGMHDGCCLGGVEAAAEPGSLVMRYNAFVRSDTDYPYHRNLSYPYWNNGSSDSWYVPNAPDASNTYYFYFSSITKKNTGNAVLLSCHLHNATYDTRYTFVDFQQKVDTVALSLHNSMPYDSTIDVATPSSSDYSNVVYCAFAYAFNNFAMGAAMKDNTGETDAPNILYFGGTPSATALRKYIEAAPGTYLSPGELISTIQEMFQNVTISQMSSSALRLPDSEARMIKTDTWRSVNVYVYQPEDLYIAYGITLLATLLCVIWGSYVIAIYNHASFSIKFSTILRTTRCPELDTIVTPKDRNGADPLPESMKHVRLQYRNGEDDSASGFSLINAESRYHGDEESKSSTLLTTVQPSCGGASSNSRTPPVSLDGSQYGGIPLQQNHSGRRPKRKPVPVSTATDILGG